MAKEQSDAAKMDDKGTATSQEAADANSASDNADHDQGQTADNSVVEPEESVTLVADEEGTGGFAIEVQLLTPGEAPVTPSENNDSPNSPTPQRNEGRSGLENASIVIGATSVAQGVQETIIALEKSLEELKYTKGLKIVGKSLFGAQAAVSGYKAGRALYNNDPNKWGVVGKSALDIAIGAVAVWGGPVGWALGGVYFIGDAAGWWGSWGNPAG